MEAVGHDVNGNFSLRGTCPFPSCNRPSVFVRMTSTMVEVIRQDNFGNIVGRWAAVLQCQGCKRYILGIVEHNQNSLQYNYLVHYPTGSPDEAVADEIPDHIKADFREALRCLWVDAYNATAEMCRRAIEASCLDLGAPKNKVLEKMIDSLESQRIITPFLQQAAHKVRLGGNRGAHPPEDGPPTTPSLPEQDPQTIDGPIEIIEKDHAEAIVAFTREFFHHVYVGPKQLDKYDFSKPKPRTPEPQ
jgi:hypothetical protein